MLSQIMRMMRPLERIFPRAAMLYRMVRDQMEGMDVKITPWGFKFSGNQAMAEGTFEPVETELIRQYLATVEVFVNIGANVGYYCCHALSMGKSVIAFEPIERNLRFLYKNIDLNGWQNAEIFPIALTNKTGLLEIYGGNTGASLVKGWAGISENYKRLVPCSTIDNVIQTRLEEKQALILIDIEGAEKWLLEKAHLVLANKPAPLWIIEIMTCEHQPKGTQMNANLIATFQIFFQYGYYAYTADQQLRSIDMQEVELVAAGKAKFNAYNFLFSKKSNNQ